MIKFREFAMTGLSLFLNNLGAELELVGKSVTLGVGVIGAGVSTALYYILGNLGDLLGGGF
jgi:hypothetical protein